MDTEKLNGILTAYQAAFEEQSGEEDQEAYKWKAVADFQNSFCPDWPDDILPEEFADRFDMATGNTGNLINGKTTQPTVGIVRLAEVDGALVKSAFETLYQAADDELKSRQTHLDSFVETINHAMEERFPGKWKYLQDRRAAIAYLTLYDPENNYFFRSEAAQAFARYVGFEEDLGSGDTFSLSAYYHLCDQLAGELRSRTELLQSRTDHLGEEDYPDRSCRLLAYDVLDCALNYGLYEAGERTDSPVKSLQQQRAELAAAARERLTAIDNERAALETEQQALLARPPVGAAVRHRLFGEGTVAEVKGKSVSVTFAAGVKKLLYPDAIAQKLLVPADPAVAADCVRLAEIEKTLKVLTYDREEQETILRQNG